MYEIVIGRSEKEKKELGLKGAIFLGKHYVKMGSTTSLSNKIYLDIAKAHIILVAGKRGSGKSYSLGVIAEEIINAEEEIKNRISVLMFDTMGIFWTMKYPNEKDAELLEEWGLPKKGLDIDIYTPAGYFSEQKDAGIPVDFKFTIKPSELSALEWCEVFNLDINSEIGIIMEMAIEKLENRNYTIQDIIEQIRNEKRADEKTKLAAENRLQSARGWGIFDPNATPIKEIVSPGKVSVIDTSCYKDWRIKTMVVGVVCRKLMQERMLTRKKEELEDVERKHSYFASSISEKEQEPIVWIVIDEAHEFLPKKEKTLATDALVTILREGRQPGVCLILATQQPGQIHGDVTTQADIVISHRLTAKNDIAALNSMMQSYLTGDIQKYINDLPTEKGSAVILDDNSEKLYPMRVHPKMTWHGGEAPTVIKSKGTAARELNL